MIIIDERTQILRVAQDDARVCIEGDKRTQILRVAQDDAFYVIPEIRVANYPESEIPDQVRDDRKKIG